MAIATPPQPPAKPPKRGPLRAETVTPPQSPTTPPATPATPPKRGPSRAEKPTQEIPEWLKNERDNQEQDMRNRREREAYEQYDKTRLKDQGGFKKGGKVKSASARADGIAIRGKTRA